jgi:hypothetical protein
MALLLRMTVLEQANSLIRCCRKSSWLCGGVTVELASSIDFSSSHIL